MKECGFHPRKQYWLDSAFSEQNSLQTVKPYFGRVFHYCRVVKPDYPSQLHGFGSRNATQMQGASQANLGNGS